MKLADGYARKLIREDLGQTLFVEAGAGSGKTTSLVDRVVSLVLLEGVPLRNVAAVTFTEKAATDLRDRLRAAFRERSEPAAVVALDDLDTAAIGTLHSFAQRILTEHPIEAGLPPLVEVQDEVASGVQADARWITARADLLDDESLTETLLLAMAAGVRIEDLRSMAYTFNANWDLLEARVLDSPLAPLPPIEVGALATEALRLAALAARCASDDDKLLAGLARLGRWAEQLRAAPHDAARLELLGQSVQSRWHLGRAANWQFYGIAQLRGDARAVGEAAAKLRGQILDLTLRRLAQRIGRAVLNDASVRRTDGRLEFHDLLVLARELLRSPVHGAAVRARLQQRYRRLLLDEFQDTDPIQIELAVRIAGGAAATQPEWPDVPVPAGRLFVVGDPKQSIYRFRRADIATYLSAQQLIGREVVLDTNFRTTAPILDWINAVFGRLIVSSPGSQPAYRALSAIRAAAPVGPPVLTLGADAHSDGPTAAVLREREADDVVVAVQTALAERWQVAAADGQWRDIELSDIAILVPARTSLPQLENALDAAGLGYHPGATSLVYRSREVRDLLTAARAIDDPSDELALVTALRSPLFGCGDDDLWTWRTAGGRFNLFSSATVEPSHPVAEAVACLKRLHNDRQWLAPSEVLTRIATDRRMFEQAVGFPRTRDVWRRLRFVIDQARAWSDSEHGGLRGYLAWATRQGSDTARVAEAALPETDADTLKIMTIHSAKGLEFPMVIVSGLSTRIVRPQPGVQVLWPRAGGYELKLGSTVKTADFDAAQPIDEQMGADEKMRLLYVACTRARDHLVVSLHRKSDGVSTSAQLLSGACPAVPSLGSGIFAPAVVVRPEVAAPPSFGTWAATIGVARAAAARTSAVSASGFEGLLPSVSAAVDAGLAKGARDLELAPWHKGRYGTAIGRAVHGVLQSVDLTSDSFSSASSVPSPSSSPASPSSTPSSPSPSSVPASSPSAPASPSSAPASSPSAPSSSPSSPAFPPSAPASSAPAPASFATASSSSPSASAPTAPPSSPSAPPSSPTAPSSPPSAPAPSFFPASDGGFADALAAQVLAEGVVPFSDLVGELAMAALSAPLIRRAARLPHWRESYVATTVGTRVLEGIVDLMFRDEDGLVIVDYKTDAVPATALTARVSFYRPQMAAYAAAVEAAVGEPVARCVLLFLSPSGAQAWEVPEIPAAITAIRASVLS